MAIENLYWASGQTFVLTDGTGAGTDIDDDPDSPDANQVDGSNNAMNLRAGFQDPVGNPSAVTNSQQFRVFLGKNGGGQSATWAIDVYENGTLRSSAIATGTTSTTSGELVTGNWTYSGFTNADGSGVEIVVRQTAGNRDLFVGAIEWVADTVVIKSASDTLLPSISDASSINKLLFLAVSDSITPSIADTVTLIKFIGLVDSLLPKIDEPVDSGVRKWIALAEQILPALDDQISSAGTISRSDQLILALIDEVASNKAIFGVSDELITLLSDSSLLPSTIVSVSSDPFDDQQTGIDITGYGFLATQGTGKVEVGDSSVYASANLEEQTVTNWTSSVVTFTGVVDTLGPSDQRWLFVTNDTGATSAGTQVGTHRAHAFALADSVNILPSGEDTTAQLTPPAGKTTGDFGGGRIQDDENPTDIVDVDRNQYREDEWAIIALDAAVLHQQYEFRVVVDGLGTTPYTELVVPVWTLATPATPIPVSDTLLVSVTDLVALFKQIAIQDDLRISITEAMSIFSAFTRNDDLFVRLDSVASIISSLSRSDSLSIRLDYVVNLFVALSRTDDLSPQLVDNLGTVLAFLSRTDVLFPFITDVSSIQEVFTKYALTDELLPKIDETFQILSSLAISDDILPRLDDTAAIIAVFARIALSDDILPTLNEAVSIIGGLSLVDDLNLTIDDVLDILSFIVGRYRWRNDDGTESTATWLQPENTDVEREININTRLRIQVDTGGDTGVTQFVLQYRKVGDPDWEWRDVI